MEFKDMLPRELVTLCNEREAKEWHPSSAEDTDTLARLKSAVTDLVTEAGYTISYGDNTWFAECLGNSHKQIAKDGGITLRPWQMPKPDQYDSTYGVTDAYLRQMILKPGLNPWLNTRVLLHEYGHVLQPDMWKILIKENMSAGNDTVEAAAEFFSYFVLRHYGLEYWPSTWNYFLGFTWKESTRGYRQFMESAKRATGENFITIPAPTTVEETQTRCGLANKIARDFIDMAVPHAIDALESKGVTG